MTRSRDSCRHILFPYFFAVQPVRSLTSTWKWHRIYFCTFARLDTNWCQMQTFPASLSLRLNYTNRIIPTWNSLSKYVVRAETVNTFNKGSVVAKMGGRPFGHNRHGPKIGGLCLFWEGELGPHLTQCHQGWGPPPYFVASLSIQPFGHNRHRPKIMALCPFRERELGLHLKPLTHEPSRWLPKNNACHAVMTACVSGA